MGAVWLAEDTKLERRVALKFLAAHLVSDEEIRKRFQREAKAAAGLSHPNICTVFEVDEEGGKPFLSLEYIEGESLEARIERGPLQLVEALDIARQIAEGLEAAHTKGVVHRDVKPGNVLITPDGRVKILDFGLALLTEGSRLTKLDTTVGTVAYMSPEQLQCAAVDRRTDIWALGCVLYEAVAGQRAFKSLYDQGLSYEIVNENPEPLTAIRTGVPMELERIAGRCLAKDAEERYDDAKHLASDLRALAASLKSGRSTVMKTVTSLGTAPVPAAPNELASYRILEDLGERDDSRMLRAEDVERKRTVSIRIVPEAIASELDRRRVLMGRAVAALAALLLLTIGLAAWLAATREGPGTASQLRRFSFPLADHPRNVAVAPDGSGVAYFGLENQLWLRDFDQDEPRVLASFERPFRFTPIAWSPDGKELAYMSDKTIMTIRAEGGPPAPLHQVDAYQSVAALAWSRSGDRLYFGLGSREGEDNGVYSMSARGGASELIFKQVHSHDILSPDGERFVLQQAPGRQLTTEHKIVVRGVDLADATLDAPPATGGSLAYDPRGFLFFVVSQDEESMIWALPFSLERLQALGEAFPVTRGLDPSVSSDGTLVYRSSDGSGDRQLAWFDRDGRKLETIGLPHQRIDYPNLSPDGRKVVVVAQDDGSEDVWVHDVDRPVKSRVTADDRSKRFAIWEPSGRYVSYSFGSDDSGLDLAMRRADGGGEEVLLSSEPGNENGHYWSPDGANLAYLFSGGAFEVYYRERQADGGMGEQIPFLTTKFAERNGPFSLDGRWVLYSSDEPGEFEVYICRFPEGDRRTEVSVGGGTQPRWRGDGKEVFFVRGETLMAVPISLDETAQIGDQVELFEHSGLRHGGTVAQYDVAADGQRFVVRDYVSADQEPPAIHIVENWYEEFRDRE